MPAAWIVNERKLRWWGKEHDWYNLNEIALGLGVAPSTLSRVINGKSSPGHDLLAQMRYVFGDEAFADITSVDDVAAS